MAGVPDDDEHEDGRLHKLCQAGSLCEVQQYVATISKIALEEELSKRKGIFGYTPVHEAVLKGNSSLLDYLLGVGNSAHVNSRTNHGDYTSSVAHCCG